MSNARNNPVDDFDARLTNSSEKSTFSKITEKVSTGLEQLAGLIDDKVQGLNDEQQSSKLTTVGQKTVGVLNNSATYIKHADLDQMQTDLRSVVKRNPERSLLVGLGIGILLGSIFRKR